MKTAQQGAAPDWQFPCAPLPAGYAERWRKEKREGLERTRDRRGIQ